MMFRILILFFCLLSLVACSTTKQNNTPTTQAFNDDVLDSSPNNMKAAQFNVQLGVGYMQEGNMRRAKQKLLLAIKQAPQWPTALDAMAYYLEMTGDKKGAEAYYQRSLKLAPNSGRTLNNYGGFLCRNQKYREAIKYFEAAANQPQYVNSAEALENAGLCSMNIPDYAAAQKYFSQAIQQDPQRPLSIFELAQLNYNNSNYVAADSYLKKYQNLVPASAASLWLDIQIASKLGDNKRVLDDGLVLQAKFPDSKEYQLYKQRYIS